MTTRQEQRAAQVAIIRQQGRDAFIAGKPITDNPHNLIDAAQWNHGYMTAEHEEDTNPNRLVDISEAGEGQNRPCPVCGAAPYQPCSSDGVEHGRKVHKARLA